MHVSRIALLGALGSVACAGNPKPKVLGNAPDLTPTVEIVSTTPLPTALRVSPPQPAYVAAFYVVPGERTRMLYPVDSAGSALLPASPQSITTSFGVRVAPDTARLLRRPGGRAPTPDQSQSERRDRTPGDLAESAFVLVYSGKDSLSFNALNDRVIGVSLPGYADEALNTVSKLIRSAASGTGAWSMVAVPFRP